MKIAKLTWLYNGNYGSVLQAFALQKFLENEGYNVIDLNYKPSISTKLINWVTSRNSFSLFFDKYKGLKNKSSFTDDTLIRARAENFKRFKEENIKLTKLCKNPRELKKVAEDYDVFICGSDQIWSPKLMNPIFYFSFLNENKIKISYAPSFGVTDTTVEKKKKIGKLLEKFDYISIRENQGQELIKEITGKDVPVQVDPTMLLDKDEWEKYSGTEKIIEKDYVFCYLLTPNKEYIENVRKFAKEKNLEVVIVPTEKGPFNTGFIEHYEAGPKEWLNLLKNSSYVFTDSFHGCIFSVIFQKNVFLYKRFSDNSKKSENSRIYTLTKWLEIEERLIDNTNMEKIFDLKNVDYEKVAKNLRNKSQESSKWLLDVINESENKIGR